MSWDCRKICCPFDNGEECLHDGTCALVQGKKFDYPYIKSAFEKCKSDTIAEYKAILLEQFVSYNARFGRLCIQDVREILDDAEIKIKEQEDG